MRSGSCPRHPPSPPEPFHSMRQAIFAALPIVLALILLPTLAFASPPDPSWAAGFYDGADGDDVVSLVYETSATNAAHRHILVYFPVCNTCTSSASSATSLTATSLVALVRLPVCILGSSDLSSLLCPSCGIYQSSCHLPVSREAQPLANALPAMSFRQSRQRQLLRGVWR